MPTVTLNYEAMIILNPGLAEPEREALVEKLRKIIAAGADIKETALWGKRRLAYPIEKKTEGYYIVFYFQTLDAREMLVNLEKACRYHENVMRFMALQVPRVKKGQTITQVVPSPGWLANFKLEPRSFGPRRPRPDGPYGGPRESRDREAPAPAGPAREGAESKTAVAEAPAAPSAPAEPPAEG
jgi:small subunit ribosomal protein S6